MSLIPRVGGEMKVGFPISAEELGFWKREKEEVLQRQLAPGALALLSFTALWRGYPPVAQQASRTGEGAVVLLGDARHAMHPARSMGMNTCFRVADQLAIAPAAFNPVLQAQVLPTTNLEFDRDLTSVG